MSLFYNKKFKKKNLINKIILIKNIKCSGDDTYESHTYFSYIIY